MQILLHKKCYITSIVGLFVLWIKINIAKTQVIFINTEYKDLKALEINQGMLLGIVLYEFLSFKNTNKI